jgi:hypothetical protein
MLPPFWINNIDKNGRVIDDQFIRLANHMWPQAVTATGKMLRDTSRTAEIMEVAVHSVWDICLRGGVEPLEKKENYLRKTFFRLLRASLRGKKPLSISRRVFYKSIWKLLGIGPILTTCGALWSLMTFWNG